MTPKEKAKDLFDMFYNISGNHPAAKKSCRICVDEITLNTIKNINPKNDRVDEIKYWQEVKKQIVIL